MEEIQFHRRVCETIRWRLAELNFRPPINPVIDTLNGASFGMCDVLPQSKAFDTLVLTESFPPFEQKRLINVFTSSLRFLLIQEAE